MLRSKKKEKDDADADADADAYADADADADMVFVINIVRLQDPCLCPLLQSGSKTYVCLQGCSFPAPGPCLSLKGAMKGGLIPTFIFETIRGRGSLLS